MELVGIFPLHIVLFPGASYPLHIFEERYQALIADSIERRRPFGINLVDGGKMFDVGCSVMVTRILKDYGDGRRDLVVTGVERYRVSAILPKVPSYITAETELIEDVEEERDIALMDETIGLYNELVDRVYGKAESKLDPVDWLRTVSSYRIAQKSGLELLARQSLLETTSENKRLGDLRLHLQTILPKIRQVDQIRLLSRNDGYLA